MAGTDLAQALVEAHLNPFESKDVLRAAVEIPNAAGGLREAMKFEPVELHHGQTVFVVLECDVAKVRFDPIKDTDALARVHVFDARQATLVDESLVREHLDKQAARIQLAKEKAQGVQRLDGMGNDGDDSDEDDEAAVLLRQHGQGAHADGLREGCSECEAEAAAVAAEANGEKVAEPTPLRRPRAGRGSAAKKK